ncbi:hypothetical protein BCR42DRAFT_427362 [Absidia repens]|uniref:Uncharacterized protein n=1 Tax=Absidia repens TaxID=90262 RepID=A0A1X2HZY8_9FUNG|nr:hypothetical protein BCR42DRAFT_427362 [Absidia repens]
MKCHVFYISVAMGLLTAQSSHARPTADGGVTLVQDSVASPKVVHALLAEKMVNDVAPAAFDVVRRGFPNVGAIGGRFTSNNANADAAFDFNKRQDKHEQLSDDLPNDPTPGQAPDGGNMAGSITRGVGHAVNKRQSNLNTSGDTVKNVGAFTEEVLNHVDADVGIGKPDLDAEPVDLSAAPKEEVASRDGDSRRPIKTDTGKEKNTNGHNNKKTTETKSSAAAAAQQKSGDDDEPEPTQ